MNTENIARQRAMSSVHPNWWVCTYEYEDREPLWVRVVYAADYRNQETGERIVRLVCRDRADPDKVIEVVEPAGELLLTLTRAEAKRAGVEVESTP